ncbi:gluconolaconase [Hymenobacter sp. HSC-4F20]|uniref:gluconolaconase n=1 Tax=Hymenobacter sp. HSC-4F20 TaxID=2864135 RepID=UPI001C72E55A|nr:gluconolaconase [Hymenobacter sp. HSC-4F20]MBX0288921.1 gluconolaconase [Hymenobacter sp. HSC-4F20]
MRIAFFALLPRRVAPALLLAVLATACSNDDATDSSPAAPTRVTFTQAGLYPEGVEYDGTGQRFLVSSQTRGAVGQVKDDGTYTVFADDPALVSTIGLRIDENRRQLLVAVSDPGYNASRTSLPTQRKTAGLAIFNLNSGQRVAYLDLGALRPGQNHFANDIAVDAQNNIYVTDSFSPVIYKVDTQGRTSVFLEDAQLGAPAGAFGLNGIAYHPEGYLLVAKSNEGALFKVPVNNPTAFTKVATSQSLVGADGLLLQDNTTLQVVTNAQAKVYRLTSTDAWGSATVSGTFTTPPQYPTTLARRAGADSYVLYSNLNALQANQSPPVSQFSITRVTF